MWMYIDHSGQKGATPQAPRAICIDILGAMMGYVVAASIPIYNELIMYTGSHNVPPQMLQYIYAAKQLARGACGLYQLYL
jgi:hypothetical protein